MASLNKDLVNFIVQARRRGYEDYQIRSPLIEQGWPQEEIENAFESLKRVLPKRTSAKNKIEIYLSNELLSKIEKRAKKNLLTLPEQIEDILRRSTLSLKKSSSDDKVDDAFLSYFTRKSKKSLR